MKITKKIRDEFIKDYCNVDLMPATIITEQTTRVLTPDNQVIAEGKSLGSIITHKQGALDFAITKGITEIHSFRGLSFWGLGRNNRYYVWDKECNYQSFGIGSSVDKHSDAYEPADKESFKERALGVWQSDIYEETFILNEDENGFDVVCKWSMDKDKVKDVNARGAVVEHHYDFPKEYGKGECVAETLDDARRMAEVCAKRMV